MPESKTGLTIRETEISGGLPVGLQYFLAVDAIIGTDQPGHVRNQPVDEIKVYGAGENQPRIKILRNSAHYGDPSGEITAKQDEIRLSDKDYFLQFNAQMQNGVYVQYPEKLNLRSTTYLEETIRIFAELAQHDGSWIWVNGRIKMVSRNGIWEEVKEEDKRTGGKPTLPGEDRRFPPRKLPELPGPAHTIDLGAILNKVLKLKEKQLQRT